MDDGVSSHPNEKRMPTTKDPVNATLSHVLLVDDDPAMRRLVAKYLEKAGYRVQQADDGRQALSAIAAECPDFLITDWEMPHVDGLRLCEEVRKLALPHYVYVVFLTVRSGPDEMVAGLEVGADDFLAKPVRQEELLARMRSGSRVLELERRLSRMARTDALTGLWTRRTFYEALAGEWKRAQRHAMPLSCVMIDVDFFKRINDLYGHPAGDTVLKTVAGLLTEACRTTDAVCRHGGEEFCVMLPATSERGAAAWAERFRRRLASTSISVPGDRVRVTASFGVAQKQDDTRTPEELVDHADQALMCAKQSGRDRVRRFESLSLAASADPVDCGQYGDLFRGIRAIDVMIPTVACLRQNETVGQAAEFFLRSRINSTPVVDGGGKLVGILSEKDLMAALVSLESWQRPVREVMKPDVICYDEQTPIRTIYEFLCRVSLRRVVIIRDGRPTGTISRGTLLRWFRNLVVSRGLLESDEVPPRPGDGDPYRSQERLAETARELGAQAARIEQCLSGDVDDLVPYVVGGATRVQELVNDLLAYSRYANARVAGAAVLPSAAHAGDPID